MADEETNSKQTAGYGQSVRLALLSVSHQLVTMTGSGQLRQRTSKRWTDARPASCPSSRRPQQLTEPLGSVIRSLIAAI